MGRRTYTGNEKFNRIPGLDDVSEMRALAGHLRRRSIETIRACVHLAYLRVRGVVPPSATITVSGAAYQDARGSRIYPRAHVLPGTMCSNGTKVPFLAAHCPAVEEELRTPYQLTTQLPVLYNYADWLFEANGGIAALQNAGGWLVTEQKTGVPIDPQVIATAYSTHIVPGYQAAYRAAADKAGRMTEEEFKSLVKQGQSTIIDGPATNDKTGFIMVNVNPTNYLTKREDARKFLLYGIHVIGDLAPSGLSPADIQTTVSDLDQLGGTSL